MTANRIGWWGAIGTTLIGIVPAKPLEVRLDRRPGWSRGPAGRRRTPWNATAPRSWSAGSGAQPNPSGAGQVRRDALQDRAPDVAVAAQRRLGMRVRVDEPGATTRPAASITVAAAGVRQRADATIRSPRTPTSAATPGAPVPSTTVPPRMSRSKSIAQLSFPRARSGMTVSTTPSRRPMNASCRNVVVSW